MTYIIGVGMTEFGKFPDRPVRAMSEQALTQALADAGIQPSDVGIVFFANAVGGLITGQEMIRGQVALRHTSLPGVPIVNVEAACASGTAAFFLACQAVQSGTAEIAVALGAEKLTHPDKARTFEAIGTALEVAPAGTAAPEGGSSGADAVSPRRSSPFMDVYADMAQRYMDQSGATPTDFAAVAVKNHMHGSFNPKAQYRNELTAEQVLASPHVSGPLRVLMCSPVSDGAAAVIVCSDEWFKRRRPRTGVAVRACSLVTGGDRAMNERSAVERAAAAAYEMAGVGPADLNVLEVHDAAAPAELIVYEELGLAESGCGPKLLASGDTRLGGRVPVNPSGGLLSKGHPIGATGCAQIVELTNQLLGRSGQRQVDGAKLALAENAGGYLGNDPAVAAITILGR